MNPEENAMAFPQDDVREINVWINELANPETREDAVSKLRNKIGVEPDLAPILWNASATTALLQEIKSIYPAIKSGTLTAHQSNRVCNAIDLLRCIAAHPATKSALLKARVHPCLYSSFESGNATPPLESVRLSALGVVTALLETDEKEVVSFLLSTGFISHFVNVLETGSELLKNVAIFILQKILSDENGLFHICDRVDHFASILYVLERKVYHLEKYPYAPMIKNVVGCYLRLSDDPRARSALYTCLPFQLRTGALAGLQEVDNTTRRWLGQLLRNLDMEIPASILPPVLQ